MGGAVTARAARAVDGNIGKLYFIRFLNSCVFDLAVFLPFLKENGLGEGEYFLILGVHILSLALVIIPAGYLADAWGYKRMMMTASVLGLVAFTIYGLAETLPVFIVGEVLCGVFFACIQGTIGALTWNSLADRGEERKFTVVTGRQNFCLFGGYAIGSLLGGAIAVVSLRATLWATLIPIAIAFVVSWRLVEPVKHERKEQFVRIVVETVQNHALRSLILFAGFLWGLGIMLVWFTQPYLVIVDIPLDYYGLINFAILLMGMLASLSGERVQKWVDDRWLVILTSTVMLACYILLGVVASLACLPLLLLGRSIWSFLSPITSAMMNRMTTDRSRRGAILSMQMAIGGLFAAPFCFGLSYLLREYGVRGAVTVVGVVGLLLLALSLLFLMRHWKKIPS